MTGTIFFGQNNNNNFICHVQGLGTDWAPSQARVPEMNEVFIQIIWNLSGVKAVYRKRLSRSQKLLLGWSMTLSIVRILAQSILVIGLILIARR